MNNQRKFKRKNKIPLLASQNSEFLLSVVNALLHQMSQPVMGIHGFAQHLRSQINMESPYARPVGLIAEQAAHLKKTLENVKDLLRHQTIKMEPANINVPVVDALEICEDLFKKRLVGCDLTLDQGLLTVDIDRVHMEKIFINVFLNFIHLQNNRPASGKINLKVRTQNVSGGLGINVTLESPLKNSFKSDRNFVIDDARAEVRGRALYQGSLKRYKGKLSLQVLPSSGMRMVLFLPKV